MHETEEDAYIFVSLIFCGAKGGEVCRGAVKEFDGGFFCCIPYSIVVL